MTYSTIVARDADAAALLAANKHTSRLFAYSFAGLVGFFALMHFGRLYMHLTYEMRGILGKTIALPFRFFRKGLLRKVPKFTSGGHAVVVFIYCGLNALFVFYDMEFDFSSGKPYKMFAKRAGWLAFCNIFIVILLSIKNSPLAFVTGYSHERLNVLHRWSGRVTWFMSSVHVITYSVTLFQQSGGPETVRETEQRFGYVAWIALTCMAFTSVEIIRRRLYEYFFALHMTAFVTLVIFLGLHQPGKYAKASGVMGAIIIVSRLLRLVRMVYSSRNASVTLIPLPERATKVVFSNAIGGNPGSHAFLRIPALKMLQSHPFSISAGDGSVAGFVVKAHRGFTLDLHTYAVQHPHAMLNATVDGPYGAVPDFKRMNKVVIVAGGSGGAFLFPVALDIARHAGRCSVTHAEAVWVVPEEGCLEWFREELEELRHSPLVNVTVYVTGSSSGGTSETATTGSTSGGELLGKEGGIRTNVDRDIEKQLHKTAAQGPHPLSSRFPTRPGRPDVAAAVGDVIRAAGERETVMVGACGPEGLMRSARGEVAQGIRAVGASVTLHCEQFGGN